MGLKTFCPQFHLLLDEVEDEKIEELLKVAKEKINFIEFGDIPNE